MLYCHTRSTLRHQLLIPPHLEYVVFDRNFLILETSDQIDNFVEGSIKYLSGFDLYEAFPELTGLEPIFEDILSEQMPCFELKAITRVLPDDSLFYFDLYIIKNLVRNDVDQLILFLENVTDRMGLEQTLVQATNETGLLLSALSNAKDYIDKIISSMAEIMLVTNPNGIIKKVNIATNKLLGYGENELIGQPISLIINERELNLINQQLLNQVGALLDLEFVCYNKQGEKLIISFSCSAIQLDIEDIYYKETAPDLLYLGRDITNSKRVEQRQLLQYATTHTVSQSASIESASQKILPAICDILNWDFAAIGLLEMGQNKNNSDPFQQIDCVYCWEKGLLANNQVIKSNNLKELFDHSYLTAQNPHVFTNKPIWISDLSQGKNIKNIELNKRLKTSCTFAISSDNNLLGWLKLYSKEIQVRDQELMQTFQAIGNQLGEFIQRKRTEIALKESEERYRDLFENASDLIQSIGVDGKFLYVNRAWRETLGYTVAEVEEMTIFDIIHPNCPPEFMDIFYNMNDVNKQQDKNLESQVIQAIFITNDDEQIWVEGSLSFKIIDGKLLYTRAILRNITDRKRADEALAKSISLLKATFDATADGILAVDNRGRVVTYNRKFVELWQISEEVLATKDENMIIGCQIKQLADPDILLERIEDLSENLAAESYDLLVLRDGNIFECYSKPQLLMDKIVGRVWSFRDITQRKKAEEDLRQEQEKTERLLLNILPETIADQLKNSQDTIADYFAEVSVLFADLVGFTQIASVLSPIELVNLLNHIFSAFDRLTEKYQLEKIKTVGDAYMVVGGLPKQREDHAIAIAEMALDMQQVMLEFNKTHQQNFQIRIGIHSGPVVAGVIGIKKFIYDLWGDTVNIASRMESHGIPGQIHLSGDTYLLLQERYLWEERGTISIKGKGEMTTYLLLGRNEV